MNDIRLHQSGLIVADTARGLQWLRRIIDVADLRHAIDVSAEFSRDIVAAAEADGLRVTVI